MKRLLLTLLSLFSFAFLTLFSLTTAYGGKIDPVKVFKKQGCVKCHAIAALEIEVVKGEDDEDVDEDEEEGEDEEKIDPPDLSGAGKERDAKWISKYLQKKVDIEGRKHKKRFKGTDEERRALAIWLGDLKHDVPEKKGTEGETESK